MPSRDDVLKYADKLGLTLADEDVAEILEWAQDDAQQDIRWTVREYLDMYEGISHTRDLELFPNGDDDDE